jgi:SOS-response transcriptional repressor LexA
VKKRFPELPVRQRQLLCFIVDHVLDHRVIPSFAEMKQHLQVSSSNGITDHLSALERKGYLTRKLREARAIYLSPKALPPTPTPEDIRSALDLCPELLDLLEAEACVRLSDYAGAAR